MNPHKTSPTYADMSRGVVIIRSSLDNCLIGGSWVKLPWPLQKTTLVKTHGTNDCGMPSPSRYIYSLSPIPKVRETSQKRGWCDTCKSQRMTSAARSCMCQTHLLATLVMYDFFFIGYCFFLQLGYELQQAWPAFHHPLYLKICFYRKWKKIPLVCASCL